MPRKLLDQLRVIDWGDAVPLLKSTTHDLDRFEDESGVKLPHSYREFAQRFGAGELAGYYRLSVPVAVANKYNLSQFNAETHGAPEDAMWEYSAPAEVISRIIFFADTIGGESYAWDPKEIRDTATNEYAIYHFPRAWKYREVAGSFNDFLENVALKQEPRQDGSIPRLEFAPFSAST